MESSSSIFVSSFERINHLKSCLQNVLCDNVTFDTFNELIRESIGQGNKDIGTELEIIFRTILDELFCSQVM